MTENRIVRIDSLDIPALQIYKSGNEAQLLHYFEPKGGLFIAESPMVVERALDAGYKPYSMLLDEALLKGDGITAGKTDPNSCNANSEHLPITTDNENNEHIPITPGNAYKIHDILARCGDIPIYIGPESMLGQLTGFKLTRGILCAMYRKPPQDIESICRSSSRIAVLDGVENPANIGSIFRNAAALGISAVLLTGGCSDPFYRRSLRVSMGTSLILPWAVIPSEDSYIDLLHDHCFTVAAMALKENSLHPSAPELKKPQKLAIVLGNEGFGLSDEVINKCDHTVMIPMQLGVDSLNVAAASAIAFWECGKKHL